MLVLLIRRPNLRESVRAFFHQRPISVAGVSLGAPPALPPPQQTLALLTQGAAQPSEEVAPHAVEEPKQAHWYALLEQGQYVEGVRLLPAKRLPRRMIPRSVWNLTAKGLFLAYSEGYQQAAAELQSLVLANPGAVVGHEFLASVLVRTGKRDRAEAEIQEALKSATGEERKAGLVRKYASWLVSWDRTADAMRLLTAPARLHDGRAASRGSLRRDR